MSALLARGLVFFTSASVLVLEIMAGRLLAPFLGVTLETFTGIIGTVLAGISIGAWLGGRAADRHDPALLLGPTLVAGGVFALAAPTIIAWAGPSFRAAGPTEIVVVTALAFFAPALLLSMVPPMVVKLRLRDLAETGSVVGLLSAVGTAGAIFGTFLTGFLLIQALPSRPIVFGLGAALAVAGAWMWLRARATTTAVVALVIAGAASAGLAVTDGPCERETAYFCTRVTIDPQRASGRVLWLDALRHSYVDLDDPTHLEFRYAQAMADVVATTIPEGPIETLFIGGGGLTLPRYLVAVRPGSQNLVLELDPVIADIAREELGFGAADETATRVVTGDARLGIADAPTGRFDLVIGDAFGGPSVPWHLTTKEFVEDVHARLAPGGVYTLNVIDYPPLDFVRAEMATIAAVFEHAALVAPAAYVEGRQGGNFVLVGSDSVIDTGTIAAATAVRGTAEVAISAGAVDDFVQDARVLTDDFAPVDQLIGKF